MTSPPANRPSQPHFRSVVERILPIMSAPAPNRTSPPIDQSASQTYTNPNNNQQLSGFYPSIPGAAPLVAFHERNRRLPVEAPSRRYDAGSSLSMASNGQWRNHENSKEIPIVDSEMISGGVESCRPSSISQPPTHPPPGTNPLHYRQSSGESGNSSGNERKMGKGSHGSRQSGQAQHSTAKDWFDSFNSDVRGHQSYPNYENDSPYYMPRRKHPESSKASRTRSIRGPYDTHQRLTAARVPQASVEESNSESFRSVIDDLTVKNQKLKKRLRKLEGLQGRGTQGERLFEVRIHDLPDNKKHELERILQKFSASLENISPDESSGNRTTSGGPANTIADSGYNSQARDGSSHGSKSSSSRPNPQFNAEVAKMKVVVAKLEQLFTGAKAIVGDHAHAQLQRQQDISNSAAADDRLAAQAAGIATPAEGNREAEMMEPGPEGKDTATGGSGSTKDIRSLDNSNSGSPEGLEQRPTRPIDLDLWRMQVPEENIEYLTHMTETSVKGPEISAGGWVYLNLIINLAQLHTINVTPPFVKKAIASVSNKLELSQDGKLVRWKGGNEGTKLDSSISGGSSNESPNGDGSGKRSSEGGSSGSGSGEQLPSGSSSGSKFHYKPLFAQSQSFDDDSSSAVTTSDSDGRSASDGIAHMSKNPGPIIYYKGGNFFTDLSAAANKQGSLYSYERMTEEPLGMQHEYYTASPGTKLESPLHNINIDDLSDEAEHEKERDPDAMEVDGEAKPVGSDAAEDDEDDVIHFSPQFASPTPSNASLSPIEFEASGIGGVLPADNFKIDCQTRHYILPDSHLPISRSRRAKHARKFHHRIPQSSLDAFIVPASSPKTPTRSPRRASTNSPDPSQAIFERRFAHEILSSKTTHLLPSALPPASFIVESPSTSASPSSGFTTDDSAEDVSPRSSGSDEYFGMTSVMQLDGSLPVGVMLGAQSSGDENSLSSAEAAAIGLAARLKKQSPSSIATAGDESRSQSVLGDMDLATGDDATFEQPLTLSSMDDDSSSSRVIRPHHHHPHSHPRQHHHHHHHQGSRKVEGGLGAVAGNGSTAPGPMQGMGIGAGFLERQIQQAGQVERPSLKRTRMTGSVKSAGSATQSRAGKNMKMMGGPNSGGLLVGDGGDGERTSASGSAEEGGSEETST